MPRVNGITKRQLLVFEFIKTYIEMKKHAPSMQDIASGLGMKSRSNIHRIIHSLCEQGKLSINPNKARTIEVR